MKGLALLVVGLTIPTTASSQVHTVWDIDLRVGSTEISGRLENLSGRDQYRLFLVGQQVRIDSLEVEDETTLHLYVSGPPLPHAAHYVLQFDDHQVSGEIHSGGARRGSIEGVKRGGT